MNKKKVGWTILFYGYLGVLLSVAWRQFYYEHYFVGLIVCFVTSLFFDVLRMAKNKGDIY